MFGVNQPVFSNRDDGDVAPWKLGINLKSGETLRFQPLHGVGDCLTVFVHGQKVKYNGRYVDVVCGAKNSHLGFNFNCPFCSHPDENTRKVRVVRYMLGKVGKNSSRGNEGDIIWLELKWQIFSALSDWEKAMTQDTGQVTTVAFAPVSVNRQGADFSNTKYNTTVLRVGEAVQLNEKDTAAAKRLVDWLKGNVMEWDATKLQQVYNNALGGGGESAKPTVTAEEEVIGF